MLTTAGVATTEAYEAGLAMARYVVLEEVGRGAMGRVLRAYDPKLQREVALKEMRGGALDSDAAAQLVSEARAMAKLSHPNVVAVYDVEQLASGRVVLVMEYVAGATVSAWLQRARTWQEIVACFRAAGSGLAAAHAAGLLHRDFKPSNVLVAAPDVVKVADFGLATAHRDAQPDPHAHIVLGTPRYMPPEQHRGESLTPAADQYAFCVALWEALAGAPPFDGRALAEAKSKGPPAWPGGPTPREVIAAIVRGLSPDPRARWPDIDALLDALAYDPAKRRRRWLTAGIAATVVGASALGLHAWVDARAQKCSHSAAVAHLAGVWDDARRAEVERAMLGLQGEYAIAAWARTASTLDAYADAWTSMHVETCAATTVRREQSSAAMDLRMACLHRAAVELAAVTGALASADAATVQKADDLTASLRPLARCAELDALQAEVEPPQPDDAEAVDAARSQLARARAAAQVGHNDEARAAMDSARASVTAVSYEPVQTELAYVEGIVLESAGDYEGAQRVLVGGLQLALRLRQWDYARDIASYLLFIVGYELRRFDEGLGYLELASGLAQDDPEREASLRNRVGLVLSAMGKHEQAEAEHRRNLAAREALLGPDHLDVAQSRNNLAMVLYARGAWQDAATEFRRTVEHEARLLGADHPRVASTRSNLAVVLSSLGRLDEALVEQRRALAVVQTVLGAEHPRVATAHNNVGDILLAQRDYAEAESEFRRALAVSDQALGAEHPQSAWIRNNVGKVLHARGDHEGAEAEHRRALASLQRALGPEHVWVADCRYDLANALAGQGRFAEAAVEHRRELAQRLDALGAEHPLVAKSRARLAAVLLEIAEVSEARALAEAAWRRAAADDIALDDRAEITFVLARACGASTDEADKRRGRALAEQALADYEASSFGDTPEAARVRTWLDAAIDRE